MKKKIKDLTEEEIEKICDNNYRKYKTCYNCPLQIGEDSCFKYLDLGLILSSSKTSLI